MSLRLTVVCNEFPYPVIHGGRADVWHRLRAFRKQGVSIHLIAWYVQRHGPPTESDLSEVRKIVDSVDVLPISLGFLGLAKRLAYLPAFPPHASSRIPPRNWWQGIRKGVHAFHPDAIWLDGLYGAVVAQRLAREEGVPIIFRSHNVEHQYMKRQSEVASSLRRRIALWLAAFGLRRFEVGVLKGSRRIFDISDDDMAYWRTEGIDHSTWLPPTVEVPDLVVNAEPTTDILFLGNLNTPNNVESVHWLLNEVMPLVRKRRAGTTVCIAGSRPSPEVTALCRSVEYVRLIADPTSPWPLYRSAKVLVNPARTGSGVQIKTVEMLHVPVPVVSTTTGVRGLSGAIRGLVAVADTPHDFASAVLTGIALPGIDMASRAEPLGLFSPSSIGGVVREINAIVNGNKAV